MKKQLTLLYVCLSAISFAQTDTSYYDNDDMDCKKKDAKYYRVVITQPEDYLLKEVNIKTQQPIMIATCSEKTTLKKNGKCTNYFENGQKKSEGKYVDNLKDGIWIDWDEDGKDSTVYECFYYDNTYKNIHISSKQDSAPNDQLDVFYKLEEVPEYIGGESEMAMFIQKNIMYPQSARESGISGTCYVRFVVEIDGSVSSVKIIRGVEDCYECDDEAVRIVKAMPKWKPGKQKGRVARTKFNLPIKYTLVDKKKHKKNGN